MQNGERDKEMQETVISYTRIAFVSARDWDIRKGVCFGGFLTRVTDNLSLAMTQHTDPLTPQCLYELYPDTHRQEDFPAH